MITGSTLIHWSLCLNKRPDTKYVEGGQGEGDGGTQIFK